MVQPYLSEFNVIFGDGRCDRKGLNGDPAKAV